MADARVEVLLLGCVQGVGLRPWVACSARRRGLAGSVRNTASGVALVLEGDAREAEALLAALRAAPPAGLRIDRLEVRRGTPRGERGFRIAESREGPDDRPGRLPPDRPVCDTCLAEIFAGEGRRARYAFTHCTHCGPRAALIEALPFDRERTSLRHFPPCRDCRREFECPEDRRFHAQTLACPACGPRLWAREPGGPELQGDPIEHAAACLVAGGVIALKSGGGYHLVADATRTECVSLLRKRKRRPGKPLAVMLPDPAAAHRAVRLRPEDEAWLAGPARAVVVAPRRPGSREIVPEVAPRSGDLGVLLPHAPLHWLLLHGPGHRPGRNPARFPALVFTSANRSGDPTLHREDEAHAVLPGIADLILGHDRPVARPSDDPVLRSAPGGPIPIRLSRATAPEALPLPASASAGADGLAVGGDLKCAPALARGEEVWIAEHVGDLAHVATSDALEERMDALCRLVGARPRWVAHDLHPEYVGTGVARRLAERLGAQTLAVQHHHAHAAAVLVEHGEEGPAVAVVLDGAGWGADGTVWGGELLFLTLAGFQRCAHLERVPLPGGDAAVREPWRMSLAWLTRAFPEGAPSLAWHARRGAELRLLEAALGRGPAMPLTSSCGRLFDAVGSLLDAGDQSDHEGEVAGALEQLAAGAPVHELGCPVVAPAAEPGVIGMADGVRALVQARARGVERGALAHAFHEMLSARLARAAAGLAAERGVDRVVLAGGCFLNRILLAGMTRRLEGAGLRVLRPHRLPVGDGGLAVGQAAVARAQRRRAAEA